MEQKCLFTGMPWEFQIFVDRIKQLVLVENAFTVPVSQHMDADALQLAPKIAGARSGALRYLACAREIYVGCNGFLMEGFKDLEYLEMLQEKIEGFRVPLTVWVKNFNPWNYIIDPWGLLIPPGVNYADTNAEDDIPRDRPYDDFDD